MSSRRLLFSGLILLWGVVSIGNSPVKAGQPNHAGARLAQEDTDIFRYMADVELIDDENGWGVGADTLGDGYTYQGVKFYRFADNRFTLVSELYTDNPELGWIPSDLEMVGDRGWFALIDTDEILSRLIQVNAGTLTEVNVRAPQFTLIMGIDLIDADNGWAVGGIYGEYDSNTEMYPLSPVILKLENGSWSSIEPPAGNYFLVDVEMLSPNEGWAVGAGGDISLGGSPSGVIGVFLHYRDGVWTIEQQFSQIAAADMEFYDDGTGWAIGGHESDNLVMFYYQNGSWQPNPANVPADYEVHINSADLYSNFELTGPDRGFVSSLYSEIIMHADTPEESALNLLQFTDGVSLTGVVFPNIQNSEVFGSTGYLGNFLAVSPSRNRVIAGLLDTCLSGYCLVTYELTADGTWRELSIYPN